MNYIDAIVVIVLVVSAFGGILSGFIWQVAGILTLICGFLAGYILSPALGAVMGKLVSSPIVARGLAFAIIFFSVSLFFRILAAVFRAKIKQLQWERHDTLLGGILGVVKGLLLSIMICTALPFLGTKSGRIKRAEEIQASLLGRNMLLLGSWLVPTGSEKSIRQWIDEKLAEARTEVADDDKRQEELGRRLKATGKRPAPSSPPLVLPVLTPGAGAETLPPLPTLPGMGRTSPVPSASPSPTAPARHILPPLESFRPLRMEEINRPPPTARTGGD